MHDPTPEIATHENLERALGYRFNKSEQLTVALRHSSFVNEQPQTSISSNDSNNSNSDNHINNSHASNNNTSTNDNNA